MKAAARYRASIDSIVRIVTSGPASALYALPEDDARWRQHLLSVSPPERHREASMRRVGHVLHLARRLRTCLYCWLPEVTCACAQYKLCTEVASPAEGGPLLTLRPAVEPVVVLHAEEFLRLTNSGHVAAMALDAPMLIWGIDGHEDILRRIDQLHPEDYHLVWNRAVSRLESQQASAVAAAPTAAPRTAPLAPDEHDELMDELEGKRPCNVALLYPEEGGPILEAFLEATPAAVSDAGAAASTSASETTLGTSGNSVAAAAAPVVLLPSCQRPPLVLCLLDATWGHAHRLNRHLPRGLPRVGIPIDPTYEALFAPARKRTRETGVSTLEATSMAVCRVLPPALAAHVQATLERNMRLFVDIVVHVKALPTMAQHKFTGGEVAEAVAATIANLEAYKKETQKEILDEMPPPMGFDELNAKGYLVPPVAVYCYPCEVFVGPKRIVNHCAGETHRQKVDAARAKGEDPYAPSKKSETMQSNYKMRRPLSEQLARRAAGITDDTA
jgi:DTW domain-containing protein YfiP